jgi:hypothetical protein
MKGDKDMLRTERDLSYQWSVWRKIVGAFEPRQTAVADQIRVWDIRTAVADTDLVVDGGDSFEYFFRVALV